jgi:hypothetical protein
MSRQWSQKIHMHKKK